MFISNQTPAYLSFQVTSAQGSGQPPSGILKPGMVADISFTNPDSNIKVRISGPSSPDEGLVLDAQFHTTVTITQQD